MQIFQTNLFDLDVYLAHLHERLTDILYMKVVGDPYPITHDAHTFRVPPHEVVFALALITSPHEK